MTKEEFEELPRDKRWSFSRIKSFADCPRKHHYNYIEEIRGDGNIYTTLGSFWHRIMDRRNKGEDYEDILKEYEDAVMAGAIDKPKELMRHVVNEYINYYKPDKVVHSEKSLIEEWEDEDHVIVIMDCVYNIDDLNILRDYKTTIGKLKYNFSSVKYNQQLLLYMAVVEEELGITIHGVEIDEVKLDICQDVPINKTGKPTADIRRLGLVKTDVYINLLEEMGLDEEPEYQHVITELQKRGHPLFNRVTIDTVDNHVVEENLEDIYGMYKMAKTGVKCRKRTILCDYCDMRELCEADYSLLDDEGRQFIKDKLSKNP